MKKLQFLFGGYLAVILGLFLYSYTQVDLSLTLSRVSFLQIIEKSFQYIGYFNRPLSTILYCILLVLLFTFYFLFLFLKLYKKITIKNFWILLLVISAILTFSYNAFSYDLFNYIFAAKVVVHYHQNPYVLTALDFPKDPMLSFMHWTQNTYQYGAVWLGVTIPFYFFGFGYFLLTFFLFKILATLSFLGSLYFLQKILQKIHPDKVILGLILFACNPLVIIEMLVSSHNDSTMMLLGLLATYFVFEKKWILGIITIIISYFTKQVTIVLLLPAILLMVSSFTKKHFFSQENYLWLSAVLTFGAFCYAGIKIGIQPWYAVWFLPFFFLLKLPKYLMAIILGLTLGLLLRYVPFLWQGDWNGLALIIMPMVTVVTPLLFLLGDFTIQRVWKRNLFA